MITLDKCDERYNTGDNLSAKICISNKTKAEIAKYLKLYQKYMKLKHRSNIFPVIANASFIVEDATQIKSRIRKHVNVNVSVFAKMVSILKILFMN